MDQHRLAGILAPFKSQAKQHWGALPDDGFDAFEERRDRLASLFQARYGLDRDEAERQIEQWLGQASAGPAEPCDMSRAESRAAGSVAERGGAGALSPTWTVLRSAA